MAKVVALKPQNAPPPSPPPTVAEMELKRLHGVRDRINAKITELEAEAKELEDQRGAAALGTVLEDRGAAEKLARIRDRLAAVTVEGQSLCDALVPLAAKIEAAEAVVKREQAQAAAADVEKYRDELEAVDKELDALLVQAARVWSRKLAVEECLGYALDRSGAFRGMELAIELCPDNQRLACAVIAASSELAREMGLNPHLGGSTLEDRSWYRFKNLIARVRRMAA